ncbi:MAG: SprT family zinc-dependent metalloprotease [Pseudomonadales bacterium]
MRERRVIEAIPVEVRRNTRRRTRIGLAFDPGGYVIVEAPLDASEAELRTVIRENHRWLRYRLDKVADSTAMSATITYEPGELMHFLGHPYELSVRYGLRDGVALLRRESPQLSLFRQGSVKGELRVVLAVSGAGRRTEAERVRGNVNEWYRERACHVFGQQLERFRLELPWLGGRMPEWRHRFMRSQWGSCSVTGRISLNTHLVKTPRRLIEYVVLHELCHIRHHDHSRRFYGLMQRYMPDWERRRGELDRYLPVLLQE